MQSEEEYARMQNYQQEYYTRDIMENWFGRNGLIRPDQLAAICYLHGIWFWGSETWDGQTMGPTRQPQRVLSIGCGKGELEQKLESLGIEVIGVDAAPGARALYKGSRFESEVTPGLVAWADSIVYCESLEHMPKKMTRRVWEWIKPGTMVVIVNWPDHFPLETDGSGWDHITLCDKKYYDELSKNAEVVLHRGSHLVLNFRRTNDS